MGTPDELKVIIENLITEGKIDKAIEVLQNIQKSGEKLTFKVGKYIVNIGQGQDIQIGDRTYLELNHEAMEALIRAIQKPSTVRSQFQALIQDKTEDFVGREYVFSAIETFIKENSKGYFTIIGDPGMGKSAILAKYVQETECIAHFNVQLQGPNCADQFLDSVCKQLIERYQFPYDPLPSNATRDGEFLGQLLDQVAQRKNGKAVVIAVDALDEVDPASYRDANILYLPVYVPDGVYFILTHRRDANIPLTTFVPKRTLNLLEYSTQSQHDVRLYIENRINGSKQLCQRINERQETVPEFTDKIADKSENNFMYLVYVLKDIEEGRYQDLTLEHFPKGLQEYYEFHWRRMGMLTEPLPMHKVAIIYFLAELREPVSRRFLADLSCEKALTVQQVLNEWKQFLRELQVDNQERFSIYHQSFRDFLYRQDIVQA